jgi:hypothetical protein
MQDTIRTLLVQELSPVIIHYANSLAHLVKWVEEKGPKELRISIRFYHHSPFKVNLFHVMREAFRSHPAFRDRELKSLDISTQGDETTFAFEFVDLKTLKRERDELAAKLADLDARLAKDFKPCE